MAQNGGQKAICRNDGHRDLREHQKGSNGAMAKGQEGRSRRDNSARSSSATGSGTGAPAAIRWQWRTEKPSAAAVALLAGVTPSFLSAARYCFVVIVVPSGSVRCLFIRWIALMAFRLT